MYVYFFSIYKYICKSFIVINFLAATTRLCCKTYKKFKRSIKSKEHQSKDPIQRRLNIS